MLDKSSEKLSSNTQAVFQTSSSCSSSPLEQKQLASLKPAFGQWIRSLAMEERFVAVKIHLPQAASLVKRIFNRSESTNHERSNEQRTEHLLDCRRFSRKYEKNFYESLVFVSDGHGFLDHICFDYALLESPEKLFDLLMNAGQTVGNRSLAELIRFRTDAKSLNQRLYKLASREQLSYELFLFLRQQVLANFSQSYGNTEAIAKSLDEEKKRKKEFNNNWKFLSQEMKEKFLLLGHGSVEALSEWLQDQGITLKPSELKRQTEQLLKLEKNDFCNRIFKCKLKRLLSPMLGYYEIVYHHWKKEIEKFRKKRSIKYNRNERDYTSQQKSQNKETSKQQHHHRKYKKPRKANSVESNQTNETEHPKAHIDKKQFESRQADQKNKEDKSENQLSDCDNVETRFQSKQEQTVAKEEVKMEAKAQINPEIEQLPELFNVPRKPVSISSTSTKLSSNNSESQIQCEKREQMKEHLKSICITKLNQQLQEISDRISQEANEYHDRRVIAFQRIQFLLQFYHIQIKLFGSCASGIAVRNSDIDIAIDSSILMYMDFMPESEKIKTALERLQQLFLTQAWITETKFIKTAAIPLIKLTIDTSLPFFDPSIGEMYYQLNRKHNCGPINADITVETKNKSEQCSHLGLISTNAINKWLGEISSLHSIIIILKEFFARRKLNCTYEGGLNTFSMIVLMVAYIFHAKLEEQENAALVFERILRFYAQQFDERQRGIDILNKESNNIFYFKNLVNVEGASSKLTKQKADLEIKDPMNQQKNMTRNCYSFQAIKHLFKEMLENCFMRGYRQLEELVKVNETAEFVLSIQETNRQVFAKRNVFIQFLNTEN